MSAQQVLNKSSGSRVWDAPGIEEPRQTSGQNQRSYVCSTKPCLLNKSSTSPPDRGSGKPPKSRNLEKQAAKINEAMSAQRSYVCSTSPQQVLRIEGPGCPRNRGTSTNKQPKSTKLCLLNEAMSAQQVLNKSSGSRVWDAPEIEEPRQTSGQNQRSYVCSTKL